MCHTHTHSPPRLRLRPAGWHQLGPRKPRPRDFRPRYRAKRKKLQKISSTASHEASFLVNVSKRPHWAAKHWPGSSFHPK